MREPLRDSERLRQILEAIDNFENASQNFSRESLSANIILRHALTWNIMVIGEAANRLTREFCDAHPDTPWKKIAGMRNVLVHDYYQIDIDELFLVVTDDIPALKPQIERYLSELQ